MMNYTSRTLTHTQCLTFGDPRDEPHIQCPAPLRCQCSAQHSLGANCVYYAATSNSNSILLSITLPRPVSTQPKYATHRSSSLPVAVIAHHPDSSPEWKLPDTHPSERGRNAIRVVSVRPIVRSRRSKMTPIGQDKYLTYRAWQTGLVSRMWRLRALQRS
jgi:hypothetical protein